MRFLPTGQSRSCARVRVLFTATAVGSIVFMASCSGGNDSGPLFTFPSSTTSTAPDKPTVLRHFAVVADSGPLTLASFMVDDGTGELTPTGQTAPSAMSAAGIVTTQDGKFIYVADFDGNALWMYSIDQDGVLTALSGSPMDLGPGAQPSAIAIHPDGKYLALALSGPAQYAVMSIDTVTGAVTAVSGSPFPTMAYPFDLIFNPNGRAIHYSAQPPVNSVVGVDFDPATGAVGAENAQPTGAVPSYLACDANGANLYASQTNNDMQRIPVTPGTATLGTVVTELSVSVPPSMPLVFHPSKAALYGNSGTQLLAMLAGAGGTLPPGSVFVHTLSNGQRPVIDAKTGYLYSARSGSGAIDRFLILASGDVMDPAFSTAVGGAPLGFAIFTATF